jgi:cyclopropane fatty-acyl-phospholipid synthase-like methyltransferase
MPDVYAAIATADEAVQERLADVLEMRAADPQQRAMLDSYLDDLALPGGARVLDLSCGTGAAARTLAQRPEVGEVGVGRGTDALVAAGKIGEQAGVALRAEAWRRMDVDEFFGHIACVSLIAERP